VLILSLDTTTRAGSVAVMRDGILLYERSGDPNLAYAQRLPTDLMTACEAAGVRITDVELFAVAAGPGSFTGLRIGIATVQGLAMAGNRRVVPVSALEALAEAAPGDRPRVAAWMDAQRGEVFAQVFERIDRAARPLGEAIAARPDTVLVTHAALVDQAVFAGDGAVRYMEQIRSSRPDARVEQSVPPLAGAVAMIASRHPERAVVPHAIVPIYVRRPDVEIARDRRSAGS
jgi:tRNA threonylcarbamoyladenosine biosynthesis protein TsaB